ncbi:MAG TPA: fumarylacetoacetate hydrolase family protein, partial [Bacteroidales bacterium]|nr:fumarylacetoacetate hydrolase family protein [Bacteroidales bacterium]
KLKQKGLPWEKAKAFDFSSVISERFLPLSDFGNDPVQFRLDINGETRQMGSSAQMIFSFDELVSHISKYFTLKTGDLIYTGTPAGVEPVKIGDRLQGYIGEEKLFDFLVK